MVMKIRKFAARPIDENGIFRFRRESFDLKGEFERTSWKLEAGAYSNIAHERGWRWISQENGLVATRCDGNTAIVVGMFDPTEPVYWIAGTERWTNDPSKGIR